MGGLKIRGCRTLKRRNTGVSLYMSVARFTCVSPLLQQLLLCRCCTARMLVKFRGSCVGWNLFRVDMCCPGWRAHIIRPLAHTKAPFVDEYLEVRLLLFRGCHSVTSLRCDEKAHSSRQHSKNGKEQYKLNGTSVLETVPGSYCCTILE